MLRPEHAGRAPRGSYAAAFSPPLTDPKRSTPENVTGPRGKAALKRYNIYRNNVTVSLIDALAAIFPATQRITGTDFFRAMARFHVRATPPRSPLLFEYGRDFPTFVEAYEYAADVPWLADVARIERAWLDAYHAADAELLVPEALSAVPPQDLGDIRFTPHPATRILRSSYPALTIFAAHRLGEPEQPVEAAGPEDTLITRPGAEIFARALPPGGACLLDCLIAGETLEAAATRTLAQEPAFDLAANIAGMIDAGVFTELRYGASS